MALIIPIHHQEQNDPLRRLSGMLRYMRSAFSIFCVALLVPGNFLFADPAPASAEPPQAPAEATAQATQATPALTQDQINSLVAPIALYPDELVSQILVASTYPLEIVQAYQWTQQHPELKGQDLTGAAQKQSWDPSVQALVAFPGVLKRMNQDVTWTTNLGNAFLANQASVMDSIQNMRVRAQNAGKLKSTEQQTVSNTTEDGHPVVNIEPASPNVVYVPDYDPAWIWGPAPNWYPYPTWYYPPPPPFGYWCWWGPEIFVGSMFFGWGGWGGWGWHPHWHEHNVFINQRFITVNHFNTVHVNQMHGRDVWVHESTHRMGVAYPNRALSTHFRPMGAPAVNHVSVPQAREQFRASGARVQADSFGRRQIAPSVYNRNRSAFGGMEGGTNARAYSTRGYSSLGRVGASARGAGRASSGGHAGGAGGGGGGGHR